MKLLFISIALILQLWHAQGKQSHASFLSSRITWACFRVLFFLLPATLTLSSLFLVCMVRFYHLGKNVFDIALYEITHGPLHYDSERLSSLLYNPIDNSSVSNQYLN